MYVNCCYLYLENKEYIYIYMCVSYTYIYIYVDYMGYIVILTRTLSMMWALQLVWDLTYGITHQEMGALLLNTTLLVPGLGGPCWGSSDRWLNAIWPSFSIIKQLLPSSPCLDDRIIPNGIPGFGHWVLGLDKFFV